MSNPYQSFFDKLDNTIARMTDEDFCGDDATIQDAVDLLRRSGYVLANTLNVQANTLPVLVLEPEPEVVPGEAREANDQDRPDGSASSADQTTAGVVDTPAPSEGESE